MAGIGFTRGGAFAILAEFVGGDFFGAPLLLAMLATQPSAQQATRDAIRLSAVAANDGDSIAAMLGLRVG